MHWKRRAYQTACHTWMQALAFTGIPTLCSTTQAAVSAQVTMDNINNRSAEFQGQVHGFERDRRLSPELRADFDVQHI
jgi:hypothetical protein